MRTFALVAAGLTLLPARIAVACQACQSVVQAEVLSAFWENLAIAASPFVVFGAVAALAWRIR